MKNIKPSLALMPIIIKISALSFLLAAPLSAQDEMRIKHNCNFQDEEKTKKLYVFEPNSEAQQIVETLLQTNGLTSNSFILKEANCQNALATVEGKKRFILYNPTFLEKFKQDARTKWAAYCVLAHEIAHHLEGHDLEETNPKIRKNFELEADKFAGHMLFRMGATLEEAQAGINTIVLENETSTHPPKSARLVAIANGWGKARDQYADPSDFKEKIEELFKSALQEKDPEKQIGYYTKIIQLNPNHVESYNNRGVLKQKLEKYDEAIFDFNKAIQLKPDLADAYHNRGVVLGKIGRYIEAIADYDTSIQMKPEQADSYNNRGNSKEKLGKYTEAIIDFNTAIQIKPDYAEAFNNRAVAQKGAGKYIEAIASCDTSIQLNPNYAEAFSNRGVAKERLGRYAEAISDHDKAILLKPDLVEAYTNRGNSKDQLGKHTEAIADHDTAILLRPEYAAAYSNRGVAKNSLKEFKDAIIDFDRAIELNSDFAEAYNGRGLSKKNLSKYVEAISDFDRAIELKPDSAHPYGNKGCTLVALGKYQEALYWIGIGLKMNPFMIWTDKCKNEALQKLKN